MHFIVGILFGRFATKSLRYKTFRSTVFTHHFGKKDKILIFNFNVRFGALKRAAGFLTFLRVLGLLKSETTKKRKCFAANRLLDEANRLVTKRLCSETTAHR